jgi:hypothetical protein
VPACENQHSVPIDKKAIPDESELEPALQLKVKENRQQAAEARKAKQQRYKDKQELAAVAEHSGSGDSDDEVDVADRVHDHEPESSDFGSESDEEDMMHVDVDYSHTESQGASSDSRDEVVVRTRSNDGQRSHPDDETEYERLKRLVMLHYGDGQEFTHEGARGANKPLGPSDVEPGTRLSSDSECEPVPLELRASDDDQDRALNRASDFAAPTSGSATPKSRVPQAHAAKLLTSREMWYMIGTFVVTVLLALTLTSMIDLLPGVQPAAVSGGVPYNKWEHFRHRAEWQVVAPTQPQLRDPHLRKGGDFWQARMRKHHGIDMTVETAAALSLTVYGMISTARKMKQRPLKRPPPPPAEEIPPVAPYAPEPHPDPFSRCLHQQHRPDSWDTDEHERNKTINDLDPNKLTAELCADRPHKYIRDIIGYGVHSAQAYDSAFLMYKQLVNECTLVNIKVDHTKLGPDYLAHFTATYVMRGKELAVEAQGRRQRAPEPRQRQYTNAEQEAMVLLMLRVESLRQRHSNTGRTVAEMSRHDQVCAGRAALRLGQKALDGHYRREVVAKLSRIDSNGNRVPLPSSGLLQKFYDMMAPYLNRLSLNAEEAYNVVACTVVRELSKAWAIHIVQSPGVGRDLDGMSMRGDRPASRHFPDYRYDDTAGAGVRQSNEDVIQAPGAPRRFFKQLASSTPELAKCFQDGSARAGD